MRRFFASWLNARGNTLADEGQSERAIEFYRWASRCDSGWSVPYFNLGLLAKYQCKWQDSLRFNQRAAQLNDADEGAWWNLGIAATALRDWVEARRAWRHLGIEVPEGDGEWTGPPITACVRLSPHDQGEVVWGVRLDPARIMVLNVPLPESGRRFHDVVLHDGAASGERVIDGVEVPVFDEIEVWKASGYSTFEVTVQGASGGGVDPLVEICDQRGLGIEDWSTVRWLCSECSRGNPGPHECKPDPQASPEGRYAIAAFQEDDVRAALEEWTEESDSVEHITINLVVAA